MKNLIPIALLLTVSLVGCAQPAAQPSDEIAALAERWEEAYNAGDMETLGGLYSEKARLLAPNQEKIEGREDVLAAFEGMSAAKLSVSLETMEAMVAGDLGHRVGTYELRTPDGSLADRGKYVETWQRSGGEWRITNDIYNSDLAPGPEGRLMFGIHEVGDPAVWLAAWESGGRPALFADHGVADVKVFQDPESPTTTGLLLDVVDAQAFQAFLESEEGVAAAAEDTVKMDTLRVMAAVE